MSNPESSTSTDPIGALTAGQKLAGVYVLRRTASNPGSECPIWLAHDEVLGKDVSLHFVPAAVRGDTRAMNELRQEIKRNRQLIHPNILRVYDLIEEADWAAISMDWFEGESVASLLQQKEGGFFEPADIKPWLQQICTALEDVHKINLVHRNISPPNLFVDKAGKVLIANFGISRVMDDAIGRKAKPGEAVERHLVYMSPQQLDGETPARTDDIYSLGVTIYELLAGQPPFVDGEILSQIRKATPQSMMERRAKTGKKGGTILPAWEKIIAACLAKTPTERPQSAQDLASKLGLSGKLAPAEPPPPVPISNVVPMKMDRPGPPKKTVIIGKDAGKKDPPPPAPAKAPPTPASAPARSYAEIVAAVEADEREATRKEMQGSKTEKQQGAPDKGEAADIYPSLYPRKSKAPMVVFAMIVAAAALGGYLWYANNNGQQNDEQTTDTGGQPHLSTTTGDVAGDEGGRSAVNKENKEQAQDEPPPAKANGVAEGTDSSRPPAQDSIKRGSADATPASHPETTAAKGEPPLPSLGSTASVSDVTASGSDGPLLAEAKPSGKSPRPASKATPATATPPPVAAPPSATATPVDPNQPVEKLQQAAEAAAKKLQEARKQQHEAETTAAEAQKRLDERTKATATLLDSVKDLHNQRQQMEEKAKAADLAAEQAKQAAEEKSRAAAESKKALAEWDSKNAPKLAERDKADAELQTLQKAQTDKKTASTEASKAVADAESASTQVAVALQKAQEAEKTRQAEESRKIAAEKASKRAELDKQLQSVDAMRKELEAKMKALEDLKKQIEEPAPSGSAVPPSPAGSQNSAAKGSSPAPIASSPIPNKTVPPPAPPPPVPVLTAATGSPRETGNTSSAPAELAKAEPSPLPPPHASPATTRSEPPPETKNAEPKTGETKATEGAGLFENSLGMKFAPVGDVLFCIWPTRVKDFEAFAKETGLKSTIWRSPGFKQGPDHPVVDVTWTEATAFCKWLTERDRKKGLISSSQVFRLPTDLEWSKAVGLPEESGKTPEARDMGVPDVFPWGTQWPPPPNVGNYTGEETGSDVAISGYDDGFAWTSPVGSFPPNKYGLYDMGGNVWQWCMDNWNNESKAKVLRGASWYNGGLKLSLLSSCRVNENPDSSTDNYGFRVVRANESGRSKAK